MMLGSLFSGPRRWVSILVVSVLAAGGLALAVYGVARRDIRVYYVLRGLDEDPGAKMADIRALDLEYRPALARALLRGGRSYPAQMALTLVLLGEPYYDRATVLGALEEDDPLVRQCAAAALLRRETKSPPSTVPDPIFTVMSEWVKEIHTPWLATALDELMSYSDPRLPAILIPLAAARSEDGARGSGNELLLSIGRANENRREAVRLLRDYADAPGVIDVLEDVVRREKESDEVQMEAWKSLTSAGNAGDPDLYWLGARSDKDIVRQVVANNLEWVEDPRVVPILIHLAEDENEVARRGAISSLIARRAPELLDNLLYWAEDSYAPIRGDLASAVDIYRREAFVPFVVWCLTDTQPNVVEKALVALFRMTKQYFGFEDVWQNYLWNRPLEVGSQGQARSQIVRDFMADEPRKEAALKAWSEYRPPRYGDEDRLVHLVRQLGHRDSRNVRRAIRELARITGRTEGLPKEVLDPGADVQAEADAVYRFMNGGREPVIASWKAWLDTR
jgi:HEAT repeat protein